MHYQPSFKDEFQSSLSSVSGSRLLDGKAPWDSLWLYLNSRSLTQKNIKLLQDIIIKCNGEGKVTQCIVRGCSRSYGNSLSEDKSTRRNAIREQFYREQRQIQDLSARLSKADKLISIASGHILGLENITKLFSQSNSIDKYSSDEISILLRLLFSSCNENSFFDPSDQISFKAAFSDYLENKGKLYAPKPTYLFIGPAIYYDKVLAELLCSNKSLVAYIKTFKNHVVCQWKNKESAIFWFAKQELKKLKYDLFLNERNIVVPSSDNISKIICRFRKENSSTFEIIYQSILLHQNLVSLVQLLSSRIVFKKFTPYFGFHVISLPVIQVTSFQAMEEFPLIILEEFQKEYLFTGYCSSWTPLNSFQLYKLDSTDHSNDIVKESLQIWKGKIESICKSAYSRISKIEKKMAHSGFLECLR